MKRSKKIYDWLNKEVGVGGSIGILILVIFWVLGTNKKIDLDRKQAYTTGTSLGIKKGVRGNLRLHYEFIVAKKYYFGRMPQEFCNKCLNKCCDSGAIVFIKYQHDNPYNNKLLIKRP